MMMKKLVVALMAALFSFSIADLSFADEPKLAVQPRAGKEMKEEKKATKKKAAKKDEAASEKAAPVQQSPLEPETPIVKHKPAPSAK